ncbi:uncharacterized protein MELLADRAFT_111994 [Melampsora larici-populina 98AG31]|uniref:Uncharacterized protein n=1 Tax=Melampsora larici-populina (strain 98AG31 / pathotype 3-4-7) TaxID=747676 RepID=F4S511_MELLP|nr:uncharacterized protein MELLADRAFT_111994 [Melampsora larici-populina 98AG31]EGG00235.1 hypothetical protein MELLADRAFT_111994 [Melampsora larici-populina 98AG31]
MTESNPLFLSIDGGGTKTKVTISTYSKSTSNQFKPQILSTAIHRSSNYSDLGIDSAIQSIHQATQKALSSLPIAYSTYLNRFKTSCPFTKIWAGLSGVDSPLDIKIMYNALSSLFLIDTSDSNVLEVSNDCDLLTGPIEFHYLESIHHSNPSKVCQGGIVLIAGTGSIVTAYIPKILEAESDPTKSVLQVAGRLGGYGYLIGDEGSAYDVGKRTIKSILEDLDSLNSKDNLSFNSMISKSTLIPMILNHFGVENLNDLLGSVYKLDKSKGETEHDRKIRISEVSRIVMQAAYPKNLDHQENQKGDEFALRIMQETGQELSKLLKKICQIHQLLPSQLVLSLGGGMWGYDEFQQLLIQLTHQDWDAQWGWIERVNEPDEVAAVTLVNRYIKTLESDASTPA